MHPLEEEVNALSSLSPTTREELSDKAHVLRAKIVSSSLPKEEKLRLRHRLQEKVKELNTYSQASQRERDLRETERQLREQNEKGEYNIKRLLSTDQKILNIHKTQSSLDTDLLKINSIIKKTKKIERNNDLLLLFSLLFFLLTCLFIVVSKTTYYLLLIIPIAVIAREVSKREIIKIKRS